MKNIWNDPRSLFNGNHFSSILSRTELARLVMGTIFLVMVMSDRTYVSNTHAHVRMSVLVFCDRNSSAKKQKTF